MNLRTRPLTDIPEMEPNISQGRVFTGGAATLVYECKGEGWPNSDETWAVLRFPPGWLNIVAGSPNDEALRNHPLYPTVEHYSACEVIESPWLAERCRIADRDGNAARFSGMRHFVFAFKENTIECIASGYAVVGRFTNHDEAVQAAVREAYTGRVEDGAS